MTSRPPRAHGLVGRGLVGLGLVTLAGCAADGGTFDTSAEYADGTYEATGDYTAPSGPESIDVELTLEDDVVTAVTVTPNAATGTPAEFQGQFAEGIADEVVGRDIDTLDVHRVAGSSLSGAGFTAAVERIKAEAVES
jgi:uncharacterized protein with FMN-binding domain